MIEQQIMDMELSAESAVLIPWQKHCHELAVELEERISGWYAAFSYIPQNQRRQGLCMPYLGPYCSREAAIRNSVAIGCGHLLHSTPIPEIRRLLTAAGVPIAPRYLQ